MAKVQTGIPKKKHVFRKILTGVAISFGVVATGLTAFVATQSASLFSIIDIALLSLGVGAVVGLGVGAVAAVSGLTIRHYKKQSTKTLNKIREYNLNRTSSISKSGEEAKICRKHFNSNLKLCKLFGGSLFGLLHDLTGNRSQKETLLQNEIDQYEGLAALAKTDTERQKYTKKISINQSKLVGDGRQVSNRKWTQSYDQVVSGVSIYDRRTEISCMTEDAKQSFIDLVGTPGSEVSKQSSNIIVKYPEDSYAKPTYVSVDDASKEMGARSILLKDIVYACEDKSEQEIARMFPITVYSRHIDRDSTKITGEMYTTYNSLNELKRDLGMDKEDKEANK